MPPRRKPSAQAQREDTQQRDTLSGTSNKDCCLGPESVNSTVQHRPIAALQYGQSGVVHRELSRATMNDGESGRTESGVEHRELPAHGVPRVC